MSTRPVRTDHLTISIPKKGTHHRLPKEFGKSAGTPHGAVGSSEAIFLHQDLRVIPLPNGEDG